MIRGTWLFGIAAAGAVTVAATSFTVAQQNGRPGREQLPRPIYRVGQQQPAAAPPAPPVNPQAPRGTAANPINAPRGRVGRF